MDGEWFYPDDTKYFGALLDLVIGPLNSEGGDNFSAIVCTPIWFADNVLNPKPIHKPMRDIHIPFLVDTIYSYNLSTNAVSVRQSNTSLQLRLRTIGAVSRCV